MAEQSYAKGHNTTKIYFYIQRGILVVNDFKYLIAGIMFFYYLMKFNNIYYLIIMFMISIPVLFIIGWLFVHKMARVIDWMGIEYSTYWGRFSFTLLEKQIELLEKINEKLKNK